MKWPMTTLVSLLGILLVMSLTARAVQADSLVFTVNTTVIQPEGGAITGSGSQTLDLTTGLFQGNMNFASAPQRTANPLAAKAIIWVLKYVLPPPVGPSRDMISSTFEADLGAAGRFTATVQINNTLVDIHVDLSRVNLNSLPTPSNLYMITATEIIMGSGPGSASGSGIFSVDGHLTSYSATYQFTGDRSLVLPDTLTTEFDATVTQIDSTSFTYTGRASFTTPEPTTMLLLGTGLAGVAFKMRKKLKRPKSA